MRPDASTVDSCPRFTHPQLRKSGDACALRHLAEINWTTIGKIERGASSPTVESIVRIASALEIDPGTLITGIAADAYGERTHQLTAREFINAKLGRDPLP